MLPMAEGSPWTMTANQMYDYFGKSGNGEMIPRMASGVLDHTTAQQLAAEGNIILAIYNNPSGGQGHVVFVTGNDLQDGKVIVDGYNTRTKEIGETDNFSVQFGPDRVPAADFFCNKKT
jgi:hypothetical protein